MSLRKRRTLVAKNILLVNFSEFLILELLSVINKTSNFQEMVSWLLLKIYRPLTF